MIKRFLLSLFLVLCLSGIRAEEQSVGNDTGIPGPIADGTPVELPPETVPPEFEVKKSISRRMEVEEAPEMAGLPAVKGTITTTVELVEDPGFARLEVPLPALPSDDPAVLARLQELRGKYRARTIAYVSATVYDHSRTYLRCYPNGVTGKEISAWSNLDFNHFSGFGSYQVKGGDGEILEHILFMGLGNTDTKRMGERLANGNKSWVVAAPELPDLATAGPAFVVVKRNGTDNEPLELIQGMHDLYRVEGARMEAAYHGRARALEERRAFLLANPPVPDDVIVRFWKPNRSEQVPVEVEGEAP